VVVYRALCQGQFHRFGQGPGPRRSPAPPTLRRARTPLEVHAAFTMPFGMLSPPITYAMVLQRHIHRYGTSTEHMGNVAVRFRDHATRNPRAVLRSPMTLEDHATSRVVAEPFRLYDCCMENDGACAVVVTSGARAADTARSPVQILASAQGAPGDYGHGQYVNAYVDDDLYTSGGSRTVARDLWARAGIGPADLDVAMVYDHFTGLVLLALEDYGFCERGEGGPCFAELALPMNTHGGSLSEAYIHGLNHVVEGVRQLRGESTTPVDGAETCLVTSAAGVPSSALVLGAGR
jgi:acetyl-CoA acetyltransferase